MKKTTCQPRKIKNIRGQLVIFGLGLYLVVSLSKELLSLIKKGGRGKEMELKLAQLKAENQTFQKRLEEVKSEEFVEKEARDQLNMAKENETIVVLPGKLELQDQEREISQEELPNWQQWLKLFF